jgi:hypothetical protein
MQPPSIPLFTAMNPFNVVPSDSPSGNQPFWALYVGVEGDVLIVPSAGGTNVMFKAVPGGTYIWSAGSRVEATGTSAQSIVGLA